MPRTASRQTYVIWTADELESGAHLSRRSFRRLQRHSGCYVATYEQWRADLAAHGVYLVTLPNPADGPAITWRVTRPAARWAATTQASFQVIPAA